MQKCFSEENVSFSRTMKRLATLVLGLKIQMAKSLKSGKSIAKIQTSKSLSLPNMVVKFLLEK